MLLAHRRERARSRAELAGSREEAALLRARVDALASRQGDPQAAEPGADYVITGMVSTGSTDGSSSIDDDLDAVPSRIEGRLFADIVLRESVVKAAAVAHGVRRALSPETRNRIRFEMKREVKRSRKQRKAELKEVRREWAARQRADEDAA
jgi:hypothetical protein